MSVYIAVLLGLTLRCCLLFAFCSNSLFWSTSSRKNELALALDCFGLFQSALKDDHLEFHQACNGQRHLHFVFPPAVQFNLDF